MPLTRRTKSLILAMGVVAVVAGMLLAKDLAQAIKPFIDRFPDARIGWGIIGAVVGAVASYVVIVMRPNSDIMPKWPKEWTEIAVNAALTGLMMAFLVSTMK